MVFVLLVLIFKITYFLANLQLIVCFTGSDENPVVTIENGPVLGQRNYTAGQNKTYYAFRGIPYAEPPIGDLRFRAPVKKSNWTDTLSATADRNECVQNSSPVNGAEDCLFINVYTPDLTATNLSVMVYIYGGAFIGGNSSYELTAPDYLLDEGVVFVSLNYRVGIFGFLSTEDKVCSGNWGLKDQVLALQWVQSNIAYFGGDPTNVTLFGQSSGAASVSYLMQTNKTKGLFGATILHSGSSLNLWALNRKAKRIAFKVGAALGIVTTNSTVLVNGLRTFNYTTLQTVSLNIATLVTLENALMGIYFGPVIEPEYDGALFVNKSEELLSQGGFHKIPTIMGFTSNEAAAVGNVTSILKVYLLYYDILSANYAPYDLTTDVIKRPVAGANIKYQYFGLLGAAANTTATVKFISDDQFNRPIRQAVLEESKYVPAYLYMFSYQGILGGVVETRTLEGVGHTEDLGYIFRRFYTNVLETDALVRSRMVRMWTNFAKYGNPTPEEDSLLQNVTWTLAGSNSSALNYLNISSSLEVLQNPFNESMIYYDGIYSTYGDPPYDTY